MSLLDRPYRDQIVPIDQTICAKVVRACEVMVAQRLNPDDTLALEIELRSVQYFFYAGQRPPVSNIPRHTLALTFVVRMRPVDDGLEDSRNEPLLVNYHFDIGFEPVCDTGIPGCITSLSLYQIHVKATGAVEFEDDIDFKGLLSLVL